MWSREACMLQFCPPCRRKGIKVANRELHDENRLPINRFHDALASEMCNDGTAAVNEADLRPFCGHGGYHADKFLDLLLHRLERFHSVAPISTYVFLPKSLGRRVARLTVMVLNWFLDEAQHVSMPERVKYARAASLFLEAS